VLGEQLTLLVGLPNAVTTFTPRIGSEVLVDFINNDIDQPVIVASLYNGIGEYQQWGCNYLVHP
jgi:hypothetical protein